MTPPPGGPASGNAFSDYLGFRWDGPGTIRLDVRPELVNDVGRMLGPVGFAMIDFAMGGAIWEHLEEHERCATVNIAINFVDSVDGGEVVCTARMDRRTRRQAQCTAEVRAADGKLLETAIGSFAIIAPRPS